MRTVCTALCRSEGAGLFLLSFLILVCFMQLSLELVLQSSRQLHRAELPYNGCLRSSTFGSVERQ